MMSTLTSTLVVVGTGSIMESHANTLFQCGRSIKNSWRKWMVREWKPMSISKRARVLPSAANRYIFSCTSIHWSCKWSQNKSYSSYHVNRLTCLTSISIHRSRFLRNGQGGRTRTASRTRRRRPRRAVVSAVNSVTINLHVSTMKFGLIGTTPMTWYSEISSHMLSIRTGIALARLDKITDFTSKPAKNQGKWRKTRETPRYNFLKKSR